MRSPRLWQTGVATVAGGLLLAGFQPAIGSDSWGSLQLLGVRQVGDLLEVTLLNPNGAAVSATLVIQLVVQSQPVLLTTPVRVHGGQRKFVQNVPVPAGQLLRVGIIVDDGTPF
jgi:hypothetical protein